MAGYRGNKLLFYAGIVLLMWLSPGQLLGCNYKAVEDSVCHATFSEAYTAVAAHYMDGVTVLAKAVFSPDMQPEDIDINWVPVTLVGGYDDYFAQVAGYTTFSSITVSTAPLIVEYVVIQ